LRHSILPVVGQRTIRTSETTTPVAQLTIGEMLEQLADPEVDVHEGVVVSIEVARLRRFVRTLPMLERKVIVARYGLTGEQLSCRQAGARLGMSRSSVSAIEHRALDRLRGMYGLPEAA
jgi:RNA polymerase sigma factor (sigma-70 family)